MCYGAKWQSVAAGLVVTITLNGQSNVETNGFNYKPAPRQWVLIPAIKIAVNRSICFWKMSVRHVLTLL